LVETQTGKILKTFPDVKGDIWYCQVFCMRALKKYGNRAKCHVELVSASDKINKLRDPKMNSG
jgi:hypothetical protein